MKEASHGIGVDISAAASTNFQSTQTVIVLHPPLHLLDVSIVIERTLSAKSLFVADSKA